jgi:SAM-dependent methyltransferase
MIPNLPFPYGKSRSGVRVLDEPQQKCHCREPRDPAALVLTARDSHWTVRPFRQGSRSQFARLRTFLMQAGFTGPGICERLGIGTIHEFRSASEGRPLLPELDDAQALLLRLFLDAMPVEWETVRSLLRRDQVEALDSLGLLHTLEGGTLCSSTVLLYPTESLYIISDRNQDPDDCKVPPPADVVYPAITRNTQRFLSVLPRSQCDQFLDLCSGTGIAALVAARFSSHAWAVDITRRATRFARFNARLNESENVTAVQGDLYQPIAGLTFDRIVAHPPYMPALRQEYAYRDGGEDGEEITRRIIAGLPEYLRPGGRFYTSCLLTDRLNAPVEQRIREMLGEREGEFDVVVAQMQTFDPTMYYARLAAEKNGRFAEVADRHRLFKRLEVEELVFCVIVIQRRASSRPVFTTRRQMGLETAAADFEWLLSWETAQAEDPEGPTGLADARPVANPRAELRLVHRIEAGEWMTAKCWIATDRPFALEASCPVWMTAFLSHCDGTRTVREHLLHLKELGAVPQVADEQEFLQMVRKFLAGGLVTLDTLIR